MFLISSIFIHRYLRLAILPPYARFASAKSDKSLLYKLRQKSGFTFSACKEALIQTNNDLDKAHQWLDEHAVARGWAKADKLSKRSLSQGVLGVLSSRTHAVIVEVNCETDFVARNDQFLNFVANATEVVMQHLRNDASKTYWNADELNRLKSTSCNPSGYPTLSLAEQLVTVIGSVGENMALRQSFCLCSATSPDHSHSRIAVYNHISTSGMKPAIRDVKFGKYAAAIQYRPIGEETATPAWYERAAQLGKQLCQHIVGMNPRPDLTPTLPVNDPEEEPCLLHQPFFMDEQIRVGEHLARNDMVLERFIRVECGQEEEKESESLSQTASASLNQ